MFNVVCVTKTTPNLTGSLYVPVGLISIHALLFIVNNGQQVFLNNDPFVIEYDSLPQEGALKVLSMRQLLWNEALGRYVVSHDRGETTIYLLSE